VKPRHMLTWMLWSAAVCLSSQGHGQALDLSPPGHSPGRGASSVASDHRPPPRTVKSAPEVDPAMAAGALTLFLGGLALLRSGWTSRRDHRG
jgi:hypothetical protein